MVITHLYDNRFLYTQFYKRLEPGDYGDRYAHLQHMIDRFTQRYMKALMQAAGEELQKISPEKLETLKLTARAFISFSVENSTPLLSCFYYNTTSVRFRTSASYVQFSAEHDWSRIFQDKDISVDIYAGKKEFELSAYFTLKEPTVKSLKSEKPRQPFTK